MQMMGNRQFQRKDPGPEYGQGQGQDQVPPPTPRLPYNNYSSPVGCFIAPTDALIVKIFPMTYSPCHPTLLMTRTLHPIMKTYFPLVIPHSLTQALPYAPLL